jgi:cell wall-associated NlpC family hydrolase
VAEPAPIVAPAGHRTRGHPISSRKRQTPVFLLVLAAAVAALATISGSATADPSIASKQAQAQAVLDQIQTINARAERAQNDLYAANQQLARIDADLQTNTRHLKIARQSLDVAQARVAARVRALYMHGSDGGAVAILLGAQSLDDLINRIDAEKRVSKQDTSVLRDVRTFRREVELRQRRLTDAQASQTQVVAARLAAKRSIDSDLARANQLYNSIKGEIAKLQAAQRAEQLRAAAEARRFAAEQQRQAAAAAAAAAASASATANSAPASGDPTATTTIPVDPSIPTAPPSPYGNVVSIALQYLGVPYVWGGSTPTGFDCSGFTAWVYAQVGVSLPHNAAAQYSYGVPVDRSQLQPGDLVFFDGLGHVGLYVGGGSFIHAPHTGDVVKISSLSGWYDSNYVGARRIT